MPVYRLQVEAYRDSLFPRDALMINPHFDDQGVGSDPDGLCEDLATALASYFLLTSQIEVTAYDAQGTPPVAPVGYAIRNAGFSQASVHPREVAVCLSYYSINNRPRSRGRLYVPLTMIQAEGVTGARPSPTLRTKVGQLAPILADLGGPDVDWCVYSRVDDEARPVTNWWVDDEWDTVRSRGLRPTARTTGTTTEA